MSALGAVTRETAGGRPAGGGADLSEQLYMASRDGRLAEVAALVEGGALLDKRYGLAERTALHAALIYGFSEISAYLIDRIAAIQAADPTGSTELINIADKDGCTALHHAVVHSARLSPADGGVALVRRLVEAGATVDYLVRRA